MELTVHTLDGHDFSFDASAIIAPPGAQRVPLPISAEDFRPFHVALTTVVPFLSHSEECTVARVYEAMRAMGAPRQAGWFARCIEPATQLGVLGLAEKIEQWRVEASVYAIESCACQLGDGSLRLDVEVVPLERSHVLLGLAPLRLSFELPRLPDEALRRFGEPADTPAVEYDRIVSRITREIGTRDRSELERRYRLALMESWRPFFVATKGLAHVPGAYAAARDYADGYEHPDKGPALQAPIDALGEFSLKEPDVVELNNPCHIFAALVHTTGWWAVGATTELMQTVFRDDVRSVALALDAESQFARYLPRRVCRRDNSTTLEHILARNVSKNLEHAHGVRLMGYNTIGGALRKRYFEDENIRAKPVPSDEVVTMEDSDAEAELDE